MRPHFRRGWSDRRPDGCRRVPGLHPATASLARCRGSPRSSTRSEPDRIVVALGERRGRLPVRTLLDARLTGVIIEDGPDAYERLAGKLAIEALTPSSLVFSRDFRKSRV